MVRSSSTVRICSNDLGCILGSKFAKLQSVELAEI